MDRRELLKLLGAAGFTTVTFSLVSCGGEPGTSALMDGSTTTVQVYDLRMEGWSTLGSGMLGYLPEPLKQETIRDYLEIEMPYTQDPHGHKFTLTQADMAKLLLGQNVSILTTYALDHRHEVRIFPSRHFGNRPAIAVEIDETGKPVVPA